MVCGCCFASSAVVYTRSGPKNITQVQIGDEIKVMQHDNTMGWSHVIGWAHNDPNQDASFVEVWTATRRAITLSGDHLLPIIKNGGSPHYERAEKAVVGDNILLLNPGDNQFQVAPITALRTVQSKGIYAPLTMSGTIVVDSAAASCYASVPSHTAAHAALAPIRAAYELRGAASMQRRHQEKQGKAFVGASSYVDKLGRLREHAHKAKMAA